MKSRKTVSNEDIFSTLSSLNEAVGNRFDKVDRKLHDIDSRIGEIEQLLLKDHLSRMRLETQVARLQNKVGMR